MNLELKPNIDIPTGDIAKTVVNAPQNRFAGSIVFIWGCILLFGLIILGHALLTRPDLPDVVRPDPPPSVSTPPAPPADIPSPASPGLLIQESWTMILDPRAKLIGFHGSLGAYEPDEIRASLPEGCYVAINGQRAMVGVCPHGAVLSAPRVSLAPPEAEARDESL